MLTAKRIPSASPTARASSIMARATARPGTQAVTCQRRQQAIVPPGRKLIEGNFAPARGQRKDQLPFGRACLGPELHSLKVAAAN
jgi:hypothetical protein